VAYRNLDELEERVGRLSFRALAKDCLDLPEVVRRIIPVELSPAQAAAHQQVKTEMMAELEDGSLVDGRNILTRFLRMGQIVGGSVGVMDENGEPTGEQFRFSENPKLAALDEYLELAFEDETAKAVVFCQFREEIAMVADLCAQRGWGPVQFHGDVKEEARDENRQRFGTDPACRVFIAQYQTGSFGLNLVAANHLVFYGMTFDLELWSQARKRVHRKGQERLVNEVVLQAIMMNGGRTMDHLILATLEGKQGLADIVTGDRKSLREDLAAL
jgi:SNF2 family DNA or RNA helicase